jgi:tetratricopeptide (TPR) repeat protein
MDHTQPIGAALPAKLPPNPFWPETIDEAILVFRSGLESMSDDTLLDPSCVAFSERMMPEMIALLGLEGANTPLLLACGGLEMTASAAARLLLAEFKARCMCGNVPALTFEGRRAYMQVNRYQHLVLVEQECLQLVETWEHSDTESIASAINRIALRLCNVTHMNFTLDFDQIRFDLFQRIETLTPGTVHETIGHALMVAREYEFAAYPLRVAAELNCDSMYHWQMLEQCLHSAEAHDTLAQLLEDLTQRFPNVWRFWNNLGVTYFALGMWHAAITCYNRAIELDINKYHSWNNLGEVYCRLHNYEKAHAYLQRAIDLEPTYAESHRLIAECHLSRGEFEEAQQSLAHAARLGDDLAPAFASHITRILNMRNNSRSAA